MADLKRWFSKGDYEVEIEGIKIKIPPFGVDQMSSILKVTKDTDEKKQAEGLKELVRYVLKYNFPDLKEDEFRKISPKVIGEIANAITQSLQ